MCDYTIETCPLCNSDNVGEYYRQSAETSDGTRHQARMYCFNCGHFWFADIEDETDEEDHTSDFNDDTDPSYREYEPDNLDDIPF